MVLGEAIGLALVGIGGGLCATLLLNQFLRSLLFGLKPTNSLTLTLLSAAALVAATESLPH